MGPAFSLSPALLAFASRLAFAWPCPFRRVGAAASRPRCGQRLWTHPGSGRASSRVPHRRAPSVQRGTGRPHRALLEVRARSRAPATRRAARAAPMATPSTVFLLLLTLSFNDRMVRAANRAEARWRVANGAVTDDPTSVYEALAGQFSLARTGLRLYHPSEETFRNPRASGLQPRFPTPRLPANQQRAHEGGRTALARR